MVTLSNIITVLYGTPSWFMYTYPCTRTGPFPAPMTRALAVDVGLFLGLIVSLIGYSGNPAGETPPKNESLTSN